MSAPVVLFMKAALSPGARWVTVHPHGKDEKGQPILIEPAGDGSFKVVGGAGGSLNHLRLHGVKPEGSYTETLRERAKARRDIAKRQRERDKAAGIHEAKTAAHERLSLTHSVERRAFVQGVAEAMGWAPEDWKFDESKVEGATDHVLGEMRREHERRVFKRAQDAVRLNRERMVADASARQEAEFGEVPLDADGADELGVQDLDPVRTEPIGLGFAPDYKNRAGDEAEVKADAEPFKAERGEGVRKAAIARGETAKLVRENLEAIRDDDHLAALGPKLVEAKKALDLLKLEKRMRLVDKQVRDQRKRINDSIEEPKAFAVEIDEAKVDEKVEADIANDLRTISTRAFLSEVNRVAPNAVATLGKHVGAGAFNSINALALAAGGAALVDRSVVDVLGIAGGAAVLARRLHSDLTPDEVKHVADGMQEFHLHHYMEASKEAIARARELQEQAKEIELGAIDHADDLTALQEINRRRADAIGESKKVLAQALGEMEANAALVYAMGQGKGDKPFEVNLGEMPVESAIQQLRAIGLQRGDYTLETVSGNRVAKILPHGMDRLAAPVNRADLEQTKRNLDIASGRYDESGWLPLGIADRPDLDMQVKPGVAASLAVPFEPGADLESSVRDYIGGRAADGDLPADIVSDLQSADFIRKVGWERAGEYRDVLDRLAPLQDEKGRMKPADSLREPFERLAEDFVSSRYGGEMTPLHKQTFDVDHTSIESLHRALASEPAGTAAYKPIGEMTPQDQGALREFFAKHVAKESPDAAAMRHELERTTAAEPEKTVEDMFGGSVTNPEWSEWKARHDELASQVRESSTTWPRYVEAMRGPERAYSAMQDLVRSRVGKAFADSYNRLRPGAPLKLGRTTIRDNLNHLDAVDPAAREARLAKERALVDSLRNRVAGRYASGGVRDKLDAAREDRAGEEAAQMSFFAAEPAPAEEKPLGADERYTLGHDAERKIAEMMPAVGANFRPGQPVKMFRPDMSGGKNWPRQRAVKMLDANKRVVLSFGTGSGKAQPLDAKVLTPTGWCRMGDLRIGDEVIASDGTVTHVTGVYPQGQKKIFRVTFDDGAQTECCDEHLWFTQTARERKNAGRGGIGYDGEVRPLLEIRKKLVGPQGRLNHSIPVCHSVNFDHAPTTVDPYLLGVLIGDGCLSAPNSVYFASADQEIVDAVAARIPAGLSVFKTTTGHDYRITTGRRGGNERPVNPLTVELAILGLMGKRSEDKFVPDAYKFNSSEVRVDILQGLMDTDGTVSKKGTGVTFCTVSKTLCDDVVFLVRSLGGLARISTKRPTYTHNGERREGRLSYTLAICLPPSISPFRLSRKAALVVPKSKYAPTKRYIVSVDEVGEKEAQCISIAHPSRLYVTDDFIVTHNTLIGLAGFTHLHGQGKAKRGLFLVPSIAQGQFGTEALRFLEPGKFKWHAKPGASREERLAAYRDPGSHFCVMTHQSFRDDMLHLGAKHAGVPEEEMAQRVGAMSRAERKSWMRETMRREGIGFDYLNVDEGHDLLNRRGKANSALANVVDALGDHVPYYVNASADPVKNDVSEAFSLLQKMDPERYTDEAAFMRKYGVDTLAAKDALRREMARFQYPSKIDPDITANRVEESVPVSDAQRKAMADLDEKVAAARIARMEGRVDVEAIKAISPSSFKDAPADQHESIARELQGNLGILKQTAVRQLLDGPESDKVERVVKIARERPGHPGIVFAHGLASVEAIKARLAAEGLRIATITGKDSAKDKAKAINAFNPQTGERQADIVVCSDAGATGANLQSGRWLVNYDTPDTAKTHAQRNGRINRIGQAHDVDLIDLVSDHPAERARRKRLETKYAMRDALTTPLESLDDTGLAYFLRQRQSSELPAGTR